MNSKHLEKRKIKIMQITHDLAIGGLQQVVVNICRAINRDVFDISVLCLRSRGEFVPEVEEMGIKVFSLPLKEKGTDYMSFLKVAKILRQEKIEVIHTHNTQPFVDGTIGALLSGIKTIVHTDHARNFPDKFRYMLAEHVMSYFAYKVIGVSGHTSENLIKYEKIKKNKIMTLENGVDGSRFDIEIDQRKKREELGIRKEGPVIGLCVRLTEQKGIVYLLKAMPDIIDSFPDINLVIVGDGELKEDLKKEAIQLCIQDNLFFIGSRLDIPEILKLFDIYVLPSLWEGLPMVLLEAMAAGCPIVTTDVGGIAKAVKNKYNGHIVSPRSSRQLAKAILNLLKDEELRSEYSQNGFKLFKKEFSSEIMVKKYERLYLRR